MRQTSSSTSFGAPIHGIDKERYDRLIRAHADTAPAAFAAAVEHGRELTADEAVAFALGAPVAS